ncbi:nischarin-like [Drosophila miranda]|uniref:nischarin-like n=1 Tax=Drosophila miranda TaxID=7229 RepID=UPI00143F4096|nr:nischarin-like [Drosophila miranda]
MKLNVYGSNVFFQDEPQLPQYYHSTAHTPPQLPNKTILFALPQGTIEHYVKILGTMGLERNNRAKQLLELNPTIASQNGNLLTQIDGSVRTAPKLRRLVLEQNRIRVVQNLDELPHLQLLSLSGNLIAECVDWHLTMGNLVALELAQNKLKSLKGLRKLLSLVNLDLSCNQIEDLEEVDYVANLLLLKSLRLTGNPLAGNVDYRPRVLARFHERAVEISLDNERGSQQELDTALVLSALLQLKQRQRQK